MQFTTSVAECEFEHARVMNPSTNDEQPTIRFYCGIGDNSFKLEEVEAVYQVEAEEVEEASG